MTCSSLRAASNGTDGISAHPSLGFTGGRRIALALGGPHLWRPDFGVERFLRPNARPREGGRWRLRCGVDSRAVLRYWLDLCGLP